jgi:glycosyltransferase involved in cell wall biosynthesis
MFRDNQEPAVAPPSSVTSRRPFWSVMIPTFRPQAKYLRQTIESVLDQGVNPAQIQIEVVDDCSPDTDTGAMVEAIAGGRVSFFKTPKNLGLCGCWNKCIERAEGEWVHILHQDDYALPGFYDRLSQAAAAHPEISLVAARSFYVDDDGIILGVSDRVPDLEQGSRDAKLFYYNTPLLCVGIAVKRSFYQSHGGFRPDLNFVLDREMWARAISDGGGVVTPEVLSCYRIFNGSETSRLARTGETLRDLDRLSNLFAERYPDFDRTHASERVCELAMRQFRQFAKTGDLEAANANLAHWKTVAPLRRRLRRYAGVLAGKILRRRA